VTAPAVAPRWPERPSPAAGGSAARRSGGPAAAEPRPLPSAGPAAGIREAVAAARQRGAAELSRTIRRAAPLGAVLLTMVAAHAGLAPHLAVRGAASDVLLVAVAAVALGAGSRTGAGFGFAAGLGADVFLATPLGTSALAYTLLGHTLGHLSRPRAPGIASSLCRPGSTCFACRAGRGHAAEHVSSAGKRRAQRVAARRAAHRRSVVITFGAVVAGRLAVAVVATSLGGVPFPQTGALVRIVWVGVLSAPFGPPAAAAVRRLGPTGSGRPATAGSASG